MFESEMTQGYPVMADIETFLTALKIELPTKGNPNPEEEFKQFIWGILVAMEWALPLSVYCATPTTFNVRGGKYLYKGELKTYTPGSAVDPTDNDTTYIWIKGDNSIDSAIDGTGWPTTEHIKLAEIDVDADGIITAVRDLRNEGFFACQNNLKRIEAHTSDDTLTTAESGSSHSNLGATGAVKLTLPAAAPAGTQFTFAVQAAYELRIDPGTKTIRDTSGQTADKYKSADAIGECLTVVADANEDWTVVSKYGTWTEE